MPLLLGAQFLCLCIVPWESGRVGERDGHRSQMRHIDKLIDTVVELVRDLRSWI